MSTRNININFNKSHILVVGDIMLDQYWSGETNRISPEAPVPIVNVKSIEQRAGGAGNVALNISALGATAQVFAITGNDDSADDLNKILTSHNVKCHFQRENNLPTARKLRLLSRHQQLIRADFEESFHDLDKTQLLASFANAIKDVDIVILSDYDKGVLSQPKDFIEICKQHQKPVLIDPKGSDFTKYYGANLLTPNRAEFELIAGKCENINQISQRAVKIIEQYNFEHLLITLSEDGMLLVSNDGSSHHINTKAREVFDVTGAGDTVIATFATAIAANVDYKKAMELANIAAGIVVGKLGTSTVTQTELKLEISRQHPSLTGKIHSRKQLKSIIKSLQQQNQTVVITNGCFDLLHAGHISYLQAAQKLGDVLIVAVNSDKSVQNIKGSSRPIQKSEHRIQLLAALESVSYVIEFNEDTPENLYCDLLPDILVKGGDYEPDTLAGAECIKQAGGKIKILHFVEGQSTTNIIDKIKSNF